jgi:hypothetical protein
MSASVYKDDNKTKVKFDENASVLLLKLRKVCRYVIIYTRSITELQIRFG